MILSGLLIRLELSDSIASFFAPVLRPVFRLSDSCFIVSWSDFCAAFPWGQKYALKAFRPES